MQNSTLKAGILGITLAFAAGNAFAAEMKYTADLKGASETPAVETSAEGMVDATYDPDTMKLTWTIDYSDLSGDPTAAHFHGPAAVGESAPPVVPVEIADIKEGSATLTKEQADELSSGKLYFNIHTAKNPKGEIRGQVEAAK